MDTPPMKIAESSMIIQVQKDVKLYFKELMKTGFSKSITLKWVRRSVLEGLIGLLAQWRLASRNWVGGGHVIGPGRRFIVSWQSTQTSHSR